ncbi:GGDEF domain-containing protein [Treponema sp.]|uniref:GGDEF domain-containing protein n=1 Tax=Treponema sp. TaxID=166 RepID=UPI00298E5C75|nr:diguanylate cyclase [Treponema sp.]
MDQLWVFETDVFCIIVLGIILYSLFKNYDRQTRQRYFIRSVVMGFVAFIAEACWAVLNGKIFPCSQILNYLFNTIYFCSSTIMGYYWLCYVELSMNSSLIKNKTVRFVSKIPVLIIFTLVAVSYFNGFLFYIDDLNMYHRGNGFIVHTALCHFYTLFTSVHSLIKSIKIKNYLKQIEYRTHAMFFLFPLSVGIIQIVFPKIPTVSVGITLAFLYIYIDLQNLLISVDTLSGLNNRNQLLRYLGNRLRGNAQEGKLYVFMLDVNKFKKINDTYGHIEGDAALIRCADALKRANRDNNNFIGRYGGDEFIMIADLENDSDADKICKKVADKLSEICEKDNVQYDLSFSFGYASYKNEMKTIQDFIEAADEKLYIAKKEREKKPGLQ